MILTASERELLVEVCRHHSLPGINQEMLKEFYSMGYPVIADECYRSSFTALTYHLEKVFERTRLDENVVLQFKDDWDWLYVGLKYYMQTPNKFAASLQASLLEKLASRGGKMCTSST